MVLRQAVLSNRNDEKDKGVLQRCVHTCLFCVCFCAVCVCVCACMYMRAYMHSCLHTAARTHDVLCVCVCAFQCVCVCLFMNVDSYNRRLLSLLEQLNERGEQ